MSILPLPTDVYPVFREYSLGLHLRKICCTLLWMGPWHSALNNLRPRPRLKWTRVLSRLEITTMSIRPMARVQKLFVSDVLCITEQVVEIRSCIEISANAIQVILYNCSTQLRENVWKLSISSFGERYVDRSWIYCTRHGPAGGHQLVFITPTSRTNDWIEALQSPNWESMVYVQTGHPS